MKLKLGSVVSVIDLAYNFCWDFIIGIPFSVRTGFPRKFNIPPSVTRLEDYKLLGSIELAIRLWSTLLLWRLFMAVHCALVLVFTKLLTAKQLGTFVLLGKVVLMLDTLNPGPVCPGEIIMSEFCSCSNQFSIAPAVSNEFE